LYGGAPYIEPMEAPLWTDRHAPDLADLPQEAVREHLERALAEPMNLVVHGPKGAGKTAAVRALARELHEQPDADLIEINVADFFDRTKSEIREDPRFSRFLQGQTAFSKQFRRAGEKANRYKRDWSKTAMLGHVLKEMAGYEPASGAFKTVLLDNAEAARADFQQALRRIMEQYHETTQFVVATRQPAALIPAIRSRGFPVPVRAPTQAEIVAVLRDIAEAEDVAADEEGLEYVAGAAGGDLREAILSAGTTAESEGEITMNAAYETLQGLDADERVGEMLAAAEAGEFTDARSTLDELLVDEGYSGGEVLEDVLDVARSRYHGDRLAGIHELAGEIDLDLAGGTNARLHLSHLLAEVGARVEAN
jgi:replication factor C small subunit